MQLYLIRHGQSYNNALESPKNRVKDPPLTDLGKKQAALLAEHLATSSDNFNESPAGYGITHLYCSAMHRALQTAYPIGQALGLKPQVWLDIHEIGGIFLEDERGNYTGFPGMTRKEIAQQFPDYVLPYDLTDTGWWDARAGLEKEYMAQQRALSVVFNLYDRLDEEPDACIALVSHAGFLDPIIKGVLNQLPHVPRSIFYAHNNTGFTRLDLFKNDRTRFMYLNRIDHLKPDLRTW